MANYMIQLDRDSCIGTFACSAEAPDLFDPGDDAKVNLLKSVFNEESECFELVIDEKMVETARDAEATCPVDAIVIKKMS